MGFFLKEIYHVYFTRWMPFVDSLIQFLALHFNSWNYFKCKYVSISSWPNILMSQILVWNIQSMLSALTRKEIILKNIKISLVSFFFTFYSHLSTDFFIYFYFWHKFYCLFCSDVCLSYNFFFYLQCCLSNKRNAIYV